MQVLNQIGETPLFSPNYLRDSVSVVDISTPLTTNQSNSQENAKIIELNRLVIQYLELASVPRDIVAHVERTLSNIENNPMNSSKLTQSSLWSSLIIQQRSYSFSTQISDQKQTTTNNTTNLNSSTQQNQQNNASFSSVPIQSVPIPSLPITGLSDLTPDRSSSSIPQNSIGMDSPHPQHQHSSHHHHGGGGHHHHHHNHSNSVVTPNSSSITINSPIQPLNAHPTTIIQDFQASMESLKKQDQNNASNSTSSSATSTTNKKGANNNGAGRKNVGGGVVGVKASNSATGKRFYCEVEGCERSFTRRYDLTVHVRSVHTSERPYECSFCGKTFSRSSTLKEHERKVHANLNKRTHQQHQQHNQHSNNDDDDSDEFIGEEGDYISPKHANSNISTPYQRDVSADPLTPLLDVIAAAAKQTKTHETRSKRQKLTHEHPSNDQHAHSHSHASHAHSHHSSTSVGQNTGVVNTNINGAPNPTQHVTHSAHSSHSHHAHNHGGHGHGHGHSHSHSHGHSNNNSHGHSHSSHSHSNMQTHSHSHSHSDDKSDPEKHEHGPQCVDKHPKVVHNDHVDFLYDSTLFHIMPDGSWAVHMLDDLDLQSQSHLHLDHNHEHNANCGHPLIRHNDHFDFLVEGYLHHKCHEGDHCDVHGTLMTTQIDRLTPTPNKQITSLSQ